MKIYTNEVFKIIAIDEQPLVYAFMHELDEYPFPNDWEYEKILTYHYYQVDNVVKIYP